MLQNWLKLLLWQKFSIFPPANVEWCHRRAYPDVPPSYQPKWWTVLSSSLGNGKARKREMRKSIKFSGIDAKLLSIMIMIHSKKWTEIAHSELNSLVRPSGSRVSNAFNGYPEQVMLLYRQNSLAESSNISRKTSARPSLQANVNGVRPASFTMPFLAGSFGCRNAYPNMSWIHKTPRKHFPEQRSWKNIRIPIIFRQICLCETYQFIANDDHMEYHIAECVLCIRIGIIIQQQIINAFICTTRTPCQRVFAQIGKSLVVSVLRCTIALLVSR